MSHPTFRTAAAAAAALAAAAFAGPLASQTCPEGRPAAGDLGVRTLECRGGSCAIYLQRDGAVVHRFSTEPRVVEIAPGSPAAGVLQPGDAIVSVDGRLITTRRGGERLANLDPGETVVLQVRRDGEVTEVSVVPRKGCGIVGLSVVGGYEALMADPVRVRIADSVLRHTALAVRVQLDSLRPLLRLQQDSLRRVLLLRMDSLRRVVRVQSDSVRRTALLQLREYQHRLPPEYRHPLPVELGLTLDCRHCGWNGREARFHSEEPPVISAVDPGGPAEQAGLRPGDVILRIGGRDVTSATEGPAFARFRPGEPVEFVVTRDGAQRTVRVVPRERRARM